MMKTKNGRKLCRNCGREWSERHNCDAELDKEAYATLTQLRKAASSLVADAFVTGRLIGNRERARLERK